MTGRFDDVRSVGRCILASSAVVAALFLTCAWTGVRLNMSNSLPRGLYIATAGETNFVEFCPSEPFASLAVRRGYRQPGRCPDGGAPLLKPVVACAGDLVTFSERGIAVNGRLLDRTAPLKFDGRGRPLVAWPFGLYHVSPGTVWVASSYSPRSFDSRYFGPIPLTTIQGRLRPLLTAW